MAQESTSDSQMEVDDDGNTVIKHNPDLEISQWLFILGTTDVSKKEKEEIKQKFLEIIKEKEMAPYYKHACNTLGWTMDETLFKDLETKNTETVKKLDEAIEDAVANLSETDVKDAWLKKAEYLCQIGDKTACISAFRQTYEKIVGVGRQLDLIFTLIRVGLFYMDHHLVSQNISKAKDLISRGGDWDRKNRLKAYEGLHSMSIREFKKAAELFLDCVSTFTSYELMSYEQLIFYTVISTMLTLDRKDLKDKVIRGAEIQEQLHGKPEIKQFVNGLYDCDYSGFFVGLSHVETEMKRDRYLVAHYGYYTRAMRALAYKQLLSSYRSLTLDYMADAFGVTPSFIDKELHQLISAGTLNCKIDKVRRIVETNQLDNKNIQYQNIIKHGDLLLNRIQKLGRVINV